MDKNVYEEACRVTPSRVPGARRDPGPNPAAGTSKGVDGSTETPGQPGSSSFDPGSAPPSAADGTDAYIPGVGIRGSGQAQVWICIKRKAIPVLSIVLNCALLGTVIFLAVTMSDLKLSVSQLDHKADKTAADLANVWLHLGELKDMPVTISDLKLSVSQLDHKTDKTAADLANVSGWLQQAMGKIDNMSRELEDIPVTISELKLSVSQLDHKTDKTAADLANVSGWLQQAKEKAQELSERIDGNDKAVQDVATSVARLSASQQSGNLKTEKKILKRLEKLEGNIKNLGDKSEEKYRQTDRPLTCPNGYKKYGEVCYKVFTTGKTITDAAATCQADGGTLAMPRNVGINSFLISLLKAVRKRRQEFWFGLRKRDGQWEWMDGTALGTDFTPWNKSQPNNCDGNQNCAEYVWSVRWNDDHCDIKQGFICQVLPEGSKE